jgi:hypothetical protein
MEDMSMQPAEPFDINSPVGFFAFIKRLLVSDFMPHGHCYYWRPDILWLNVLSDAMITISYYSIPIILIYFVIRKKDVPFNAIFLMFGAFIFMCGTTHAVEIVTTWVPMYRLEGVIKLLTGLISVATVFMMIPVIPRALAMPNLEAVNELLRQKAGKLEEANQSLKQFSKMSAGREIRMIDLKREVNELLMKSGMKPKYDLSG